MSSDCLVYKQDDIATDRTMFKFSCNVVVVIDNEYGYKHGFDFIIKEVAHRHQELCEVAKKKFNQDNYYKNTQEEYGTAPKFPTGKPATTFHGNFYIGPGAGIAGDPLEGWKSLGYTTENSLVAEEKVQYHNWNNIKSKTVNSNWHEGDDGITYVHHTSGGSSYYVSTEVHYTPAYSQGRPPIDQMPGLRARVKHPIQGHDWYTLENVIISLNDMYRWTREQIADWLDTLDIDLSFKTETSV